MPHLNTIDRRILEDYFQMGGGNVLDFTIQTFQQAIFDFCGEDIYTDKYAEYGNSKGKRLRCFFSKASKTELLKVVSGLLDYAKACVSDRDISKEEAIEKIIARLGGTVPVSQESEENFLKKEFSKVDFSTLSLEPSFVEILAISMQVFRAAITQIQNKSSFQ